MSAALTTELAARWVGMFMGRPCTERTVRRWVETGRLPNRGTKHRIIVWTDDLIDMFSAAA
jgi:hypothetical protein